MDYPILLTHDGKYEAILQNAYNIIVEDEILTTSGGYETLTFLISNSDKKRHLLGNERILEVQGRRYVIRVIEDLKNNSNICTVTCDAAWYDLNDGELKRLMFDPDEQEEIEVPEIVFDHLGSRILKYTSVNMKGNDVRELQTKLNALGFNCGKVDGIFGPNTKKGVQAFEQAVGLVNDGIVDDEFLEQLKIKLTPVKPPKQPSMMDAYTAVAQQLQETDWTIGVVDVATVRQVHTSQSKETSLYNLRQISGLYGGDLFFDTVGRQVSLLSSLGIRHQKIFCYEKNATSIKRTVDTRNLFTRFSLIGSDADGNDVTVSEINDGKDYVENYEWYDWQGLPRKIKWYRKKDERWSDKQNMLDHMKSWLSVYCKPVVSYELKVSLFEVSPALGDYVYVYDKDFDIGGWLRVVSRKKNILQPHLSTVQLESTKRTIVETIVTSSTTSQQVQDVLSGVVTPFLEVKLPPGTEDWIMQYRNGKWQASNILGDINSILDALNGEVM